MITYLKTILRSQFVHGRVYYCNVFRCESPLIDMSYLGAIRGIIVEPASRRLEPVEAFRGVPYAAPPPRLAAPAPARPWPGTRLADAFAPVCPQRYPDISNKLVLQYYIIQGPS